MRADPYQGLVPYAEDDSEYFFGRDTDRRIIASNLTSAPFTLLYGPSGVGKTSVLRAGVLRDLRLEAQSNRERLGLPEFAVIWQSEWRGAPLVRLEAAMRKGVADAMGGDGGPVSGASPLDRLQNWTERLNGELFLIFDQFEEFFLYHPEDQHGDFGDLLTQIVLARDLPVHVLVSLRDDALSQMDRFKGRIPGLFSNFLRIDRLDRAAGRLAIEGPVQQWNETLDQSGGADSVMSVDDDLREAVLDQVRVGRQGFGEKGRGVAQGQAPREEIETPFLQLVMQRIWSEERAAGSSQLRLDTFNNLGGAEVILRTHLSRVLEHLAPDERKVARKVFYYLVTPSGAKIAHSATDLASYTELEVDEIEAVLARLCDRKSRILREVASPDGGEGKRYEIYHDVLGGAILEWQRDTRVRQQTDAILAERENAELGRQTRLRRTAGAVFGFAVMAVVLVAAFYVFRAAQIENQRAAFRTELAILRTRFLDAHQGVLETNRRESFAVIPAVSVVPEQRRDVFDALSVALEPDVAAGRVSVFDAGTTVVLRISSPAQFASGSVELTAEAAELLGRIGTAANAESGTILIAGHTDNIPIRSVQHSNNLDLSLARARAALEGMAKTMDNPDRLVAEGRGETEPVADNATREGRARNRRIEIIFRKAI